MRHGLEADLVVNPEGMTKPIRQDIEEWLQKLSSYETTLGYGPYIKTLRDILSRGNSSQRQRAVFAATNSLGDVVQHNIDEFERNAPSWNNSAYDLKRA
jgi:glutamate---cysteine ligase / carboxylate-amine ligase